MFARSGEMTPPCGYPRRVVRDRSRSSTPAFSHLPIRRSSTPSRTRWLRISRSARGPGPRRTSGCPPRGPTRPFTSVSSPEGRPAPDARRATRPEAVRAVQEVLLVDRFQHHRRPRAAGPCPRRSGYPSGRLSFPSPFGMWTAPHRRRAVATGLRRSSSDWRVPSSCRTPRPSGRLPLAPRPCGCADTHPSAGRHRCGGRAS